MMLYRTQMPETLDIIVTLSSQYWKDAPKAKVFIDDELIFDDEVTNVVKVKWSNLITEGEHTLAIVLHSKDRHQTVLDNGTIVKDQLLNIDAITFDDIEVGYLRFSMSEYYPTQAPGAPALIKKCVNLGYNGRWEFKFSTPIYIWLLENL